MNQTNLKSVKLNIKQADLQRSTKLCSKMNPFVQILTKNKLYTSSIQKKADNKPIWNETMIIEIENGDIIKLQIMDFNSRDPSELIAETVIQNNQDFSGMIDLYYQNKKVGQVELQILQQQTFPQQYLGLVKQIPIINKMEKGIYVPDIDKYPQLQYPSN